MFHLIVLKQEQQQVVITNVQSPTRLSRNGLNEDILSPMSQTTTGTTEDLNQDIDDVTASTGSSTSRPRPITMTEILNCIDNGDSSSIFQSKELHYLFLKHCVVNVISKKKWNDNCDRDDYYKFITASDEGFALVVLDNNIERYMEMMKNEDPNIKDFGQPKYTSVTQKGMTHHHIGKGWNDRGKMEFQRYTEMIIEKRKDLVWLEKRSRGIKRVSNRERQRRKKRSYDDIDNQQYNCMDNEEQTKWNNFMLSSVNNMNSMSNITAI